MGYFLWRISGARVAQKICATAEIPLHINSLAQMRATAIFRWRAIAATHSAAVDIYRM